MHRFLPTLAFAIALNAVLDSVALAGQPPYSSDAPDFAISKHDRVYAAEQFSNTISVTDPATNRLLGVIRLGEPQPANLSPLYRGQLLVHGIGFSPDGRTLAVVSIGSNSVTFIDTATNRVKHTTYLGRAPHEAFFTPDGTEVWVTVRGENYVAVLDAATYQEKQRILVPNGPGMQIFSPDGTYAYVCSSFTAQTEIVTTADHKIVGHVTQASPFCPNIAASPDGRQVWFTLKDSGMVEVFNARPPFNVLRTFFAGPIVNHVNFVRRRGGIFAYVTVGGLNEVQEYRTSDYSRVAVIPVGALPHGVWPSGDGRRIYVGLENADRMIAIDTATNKVIASIPIGQAPQAVVYVPNAVPSGNGSQGLLPLGVAGGAVHLKLQSTLNGRASSGPAPTSVSLFDQGITQVVEVAVTSLKPHAAYVLALAVQPNGAGRLEPLAQFTTNSAGAAIVNAVGPIRQIVRDGAGKSRRYLVIATVPATATRDIVQVQEL